MPTPSNTRRRATVAASLVALVVLSTVMIGSASAATSDPDRDGLTTAFGFDDDVLYELDVITGRDLEVVDTTGLVNGP